MRFSPASPTRPLPLGFIEPCLPFASHRVPDGPEWVHELKHDGYRLIVRKSGPRVRVFTRRGFDWTDRYPLITDALTRMRVSSIVLDGEAVYCREDGLSIFDKLHSRAYDNQIFLYAFDLLELNGDDWRKEPLEKRKARLQKLLSSADDGIRFSEHLDGDGAKIFQHACKIKAEGIVSKRRDSFYRSGRVKSWIKVKNPKAPAMLRIEEGAGF